MIHPATLDCARPISRTYLTSDKSDLAGRGKLKHGCVRLVVRSNPPTAQKSNNCVAVIVESSSNDLVANKHPSSANPHKQKLNKDKENGTVGAI